MPESPILDFRVGIGFDSHSLEEGHRLVLGGVEIPHNKGLLGHSDGDAVLHAIMDALLGAARPFQSHGPRLHRPKLTVA